MSVESFKYRVYHYTLVWYGEIMTDKEFIQYAERENRNDKTEIKKNGDRVEETYDKFKKTIK